MLDRCNTGLIVVDIQGKLAHLVHDSSQLFRAVTTLIKASKLLELPIIVVEQNPQKLGATAPELQAHLSSYPRITKFTFNACEEPSFVHEIMQSSVENWLVCGIEAHVCVYQTVLGLQAMGKTVQLVTDGIGSRSKANKRVAIANLQARGIAITSAEMCLFELMCDCRDSKFSEFLKIIR